MIFARDAQFRLNNRIDQAVLAEYSNASQYISAQDLGGSGTGSYALSQSNVGNLFSVARRKLVHRSNWQNPFAVIGGRTVELLQLSGAGRESGLGDKILENGYIGSRFGFDLYQSENVPFTAVLTYNGQPSNTETLKIDGVTFTFVSPIGTTAGNVLIETDDDTTYSYLTNAINGATSGAGTKYIELSATDREILRNGNIAATQDTTGGGGTVTITGYGDVAVVEAASNVVLTSNTQYPLFGRKGSIDFVVKRAPNVEFHQAEKRLGKYVFAYTYYGKKTFTESAKGLVYAKIDTSSWV